MADVNLSVAGRNYSVACRDGEEAHLQKLAEMVLAESAVAKAVAWARKPEPKATRRSKR